MADPTLQAGTPPVDAPFPTTSQQIVNLVAAYVRINGLSGLQGVIINSTEPAASDRDKVWVKVDPSSNRAIGLYRYLGGWNQLPNVPLSGDNEPANPQPGELFYNTSDDALKSYIDGQWTTELWHKGTTAERPENVGTGYLYYDTDIKRLLRYTSQGWSTVEGFIGQIIIADGMTPEDAVTRNPGWSVATALGAKFLVGYDGDEYTTGKEGGRTTFPWSGQGNAAEGGSREQGLVSGITLDNDAYVASSGPSGSTKTGEVNILPPFHTVVFLRKDF